MVDDGNTSKYGDMPMVNSITTGVRCHRSLQGTQTLGRYPLGPESGRPAPRSGDCLEDAREEGGGSEAAFSGRDPPGTRARIYNIL